MAKKKNFKTIQRPVLRGSEIVAALTDPKEERKKRNNLNRQRAKNMESRISRLFIGNTRGKVAFSGAGWEKGDVKIPLPNQSGSLYIECKLTAKLWYKIPQITVDHRWLVEVEKNRVAMGSRLGILIFHYHNCQGDYVMMREEDLDTVEQITGKRYTFTAPVSEELYLKNGKRKFIFPVVRTKLLKQFSTYTEPYGHTRFHSELGVYIIISVEDFMEMLGFTDKETDTCAPE